MKTIFKYPLRLEEEQVISCNLDYILAVKEQDGGLCLWAVVDENLPKQDIIIRIVGTGHDFYDACDCIHLDTIVVSYGHYVWHVFQKFKENV